MNSKARIAATMTTVVVAGGLITVAPTTTTAAQAGQVKVMHKSGKEVKKTRGRLVKVAKSRVGRQYVSGGTGPRTFDCSGLMYYSYKRATGKSLPRTSWAQHRATKKVSRRNLKKGDLLFFRGSGHVGMYIGRGRFVHASNPRTDVRVDHLNGYWGHNFNGATRVVHKR